MVFATRSNKCSNTGACGILGASTAGPVPQKGGMSMVTGNTNGKGTADGARAASKAKRGSSKARNANGPVTVKQVISEDSFLSREIAKAPLTEQDGCLVADISHIPQRF